MSKRNSGEYLEMGGNGMDAANYELWNQLKND